MLDKFQALKEDRFYISIVLCALSSLLAVSSYSIYSQPKLEPSYEKKRTADMNACKSFAKHKGFDVKQTGKAVLTLTKESFGNDEKFTFASVESVIISCGNIEMKSFCFGVESQCSIDGTKVVMNYEEPETY